MTEPVQVHAKPKGFLRALMDCSIDGIGKSLIVFCLMPVMGIGARKAIAVLAASMIWLVGLEPFLLVQPPITLIAGSIGV